MKKYILLVFCLMLVISMLFVGCDRQPAEQNHTMADFPKEPITILVGHSPGGAADTVTRLIQPYLQKYLGVPVLVENVDGSGGAIAMQRLLGAKKNGYTIASFNFPSYILNQVYGQHPDMRQFTQLYGVSGGEFSIIAVTADSPIQTVEDLAKLAKQQEIFYATQSGVCNSFLACTMLFEAMDFEMTMVPYGSGGDAIMAGMGGQVDVIGANAVGLGPLMEEGEIRALIHSSSKADALGDVPNLASFDPSYVIDSGTGYIAPPDLPDDITKILVDAFEQAINDPDFLSLAKGKISIEPRKPKEVLELQENLLNYVEAKQDLIEKYLPE